MGLQDRLNQPSRPASNGHHAETLVVDPPAAADPAPPIVQELAPAPTKDPYADLKSQVHRACIAKLGTELLVTDGSEDLTDRVRDAVAAELALDKTPLSREEREQIAREIADDILGYGPLEPFLRDDTVTEVMVNGAAHIYVERAGRIERTPSTFLDDKHVLRIIDRIVSVIGRRIDESSPLVDARLPDGSRVNAIIPPLSLGGPSLTIRKFSRDPYTLDDLIGFGTLTPKAGVLMSAAVRGKLNVLISGGTGTGKTTMLNALSAFVPGGERIVTIEDAAELQLQQEHVVRLESRPQNIEGQGEITIRDLVRNALRMRPDRIIVGEVRGAETLDMLQAMNTGHDGSLTTIHANSPRDALARLEMLVLMAGVDLPLRAIREQIAGAFDLLIHLNRLVDGSRRITHVTEVIGTESDVITLQDIFAAGVPAEVAGDGATSLLSPLEASGLKPHFVRKMSVSGVALPPGFFHADEDDMFPSAFATPRNAWEES
ncbi:MAG: CpaF family protein [Gaiellaceae bacterium]